MVLRVPRALQIAASACGDRGIGNGGVVLGKLTIADDSSAARSGTVSAEWPATETARAPSSTPASKWVSAIADARGRFALCGVPLDTALSLRALTDGASGQSSGLRVSSAARFVRTEVLLHRERTTTATLAGLVTDSSSKPLAGVEVTLPDLGKATLTNEQGAFVLRDIPGGSQQVLARHVGYGAVESQVTLVAGQTTQRHITMTRSTTLDSVVVTEKVVDHQLDDFEENKKLGLGHFLTRAELSKQEGLSTGSVLSTFPGIKVFATGPHAWVGSGRHNVTSLSSRMTVGLDDSDAQKGAPLWDCYALVYVDDHLVFRGQKMTGGSRRSSAPYVWEPLFDVNSIAVAEIEAIEYYATAAQAPVKYGTLNSQCGVLVLHTIRFHPADTTAATKKPPTR